MFRWRRGVFKDYIAWFCQFSKTIFYRQPSWFHLQSDECRRWIDRSSLGFDAKGSRKNKFTESGVQAPGWQGAKTYGISGYFEFSQRRQVGWIYEL